MTAVPSGAAPAPLSHREIRSIIFGIMLAMLLAALDQTIVATALPSIGADLHDVGNLSWIVTGYLLAATAVTPLYGKLSDTFGRRHTLLAAIAIFMVGSIACALAPGMLWLAAARVLQGLGGGGLISLAQTIIGEIVAPRERGRYQGMIAAVFVSASLAGPVLGGFMAEKLHWSLIFWINLPLGLGALWFVYSLLKKLPHNHRRRSIDWLGAVLMVVATIAVMLGLDWGGTRYPWGSLPILGLFAASLAFWALFVWRQRRAAEPFIPVDIYANTVVRYASLSASFGMGTFIGLSIYMPVYLQAVHGLSASTSGLALIPLVCGTAIGANLSGFFMSRVTHYKRAPQIGLAVSALAMTAMALAPHAPLLAVEILFACTSIGLGTVLPVTTVALQNAVSLQMLGTATATNNFFRSLGGSIVVAGFGAIVLTAMPKLDPASGLSPAEALASSGLDLGGTFRWVFVSAAIGLAVSLAGLIAMPEKPLQGRRKDGAEGAAAAASMAAAE